MTFVLTISYVSSPRRYSSHPSHQSNNPSRFFQIDFYHHGFATLVQIFSLRRFTEARSARPSPSLAALSLSLPTLATVVLRSRTKPNSTRCPPALPRCLHMSTIIYFAARSTFLPTYTPSAHDEHAPLLALIATSLGSIPFYLLPQTTVATTHQPTRLA